MRFFVQFQKKENLTKKDMILIFFSSESLDSILFDSQALLIIILDGGAIFKKIAPSFFEKNQFF